MAPQVQNPTKLNAKVGLERGMVVWSSFCVPCFFEGCQASKNEQALLKKIFHPNYNLNERPAVNDSDAVTVILGLTLNQIVDVVSIKLGLLTTETNQNSQKPG